MKGKIDMLKEGMVTSIASYRQVDNVTGMSHNPYDDTEGDRVMADSLERLEKNMDSIGSNLSHLNESVLRMEHSLELQSQKLSSALDLQAQKLSGALELQGQKLTGAIDKQSIKFDGKLKDQKLSIILWILGLPSLVLTLYKLYDTFKPS